MRPESGPNNNVFRIITPQLLYVNDTLTKNESAIKHKSHSEQNDII